MHFIFCPALNLAISPSSFHLVEDTQAFPGHAKRSWEVGEMQKSLFIHSCRCSLVFLAEMCKHIHVCVCTYTEHLCSASPDGGLAVPAWCHRGQLGNLSRAQGLRFNLNTDLHNSSGIKPHCHNICLCVYLPLLAAGRCGVLGVCRPQIHLCFMVQRFFGAEEVVWVNVQEGVGRAGVSGRKKG